MYSKEIAVDGTEHTIEQGDVFHINTTLEFGDGRTLEDGDIITVVNIQNAIDGNHFEFSIDGTPGRIETIYQFAFENLLEDNNLTENDTTES